MESILVIEDDNDVQEFIKSVLMLVGYKIDQASNGLEGLEKLNKGDYSLVISDINMPGLDGYTLLGKIRSRKENAAIPFIFLTSNAKREQVRLGMVKGANDYLTKPFDHHELLLAVKSCIDKRKKIESEIELKFQQDIDELKNRVYYNKDTGLANKEAFFETLEKLPARRDSSLLSYLFNIQIDGYNELSSFLTFETLVKIQQDIISKLQGITGVDKENLYQIDENYFVLLWRSSSDDNSEKNALELADNIKKSIYLPITTSSNTCDIELQLASSIGICKIENQSSLDQIQKTYLNAQSAMEYVKCNGGDSYALYSKPLKEKLNQKLKCRLQKYIKTKKVIEHTKNENYECKVFFLYPHSVIQELLIEEIISNEYAAYSLKDHKKARELLKKYNNSIMFVNIDSILSSAQWECYIQEILNDPATENVGIGVLSYNEDEEKRETYVMKLMVQCGYIKLKLGFEQSKEIILKVLQATEAKGKRKYVRACCAFEASVGFNARINGKIEKGKIIDISSFGMACEFESDIILQDKSFIEDMQLLLKGNILFTSGQIYGSRKNIEGKAIYVIKFDQNKLNPNDLRKIYKFIYTIIQKEIDCEIEHIKL